MVSPNTRRRCLRLSVGFQFLKVVGCSYDDRKRLVGAGNSWISNPMCRVRIRDTKKGEGLSEILKNFFQNFFQTVL